PLLDWLGALLPVLFVPWLAGSGTSPGLPLAGSSCAAFPRRGTNCAVTTGFEGAARFFSSSLAAFLRSRSARQSANRSSAAYANENLVCDQICTAPNENAVDRYSATAIIATQIR